MPTTLTTTLTALLSRLLGVPSSKEAQTAVVDEVRKLIDEDVERGGAGLVEEECVRSGWDGCLRGQLAPSASLSLLPLLLPSAPLTLPLLLALLSPLSRPSPPGPSYPTQSLALEMLLVFVEEGWVGSEAREGLDRVVAVLERGLEFGKLREPAADLLCLVVRRHHITPHRIDFLHSLLTRLPSPPSSLYRLLDTYRSFEPERVYQGISQRRGTVERGKKEGKEVEEAKRRRIEADANSKLPLPITFSTDLHSPTSLPLSDIRTLPSLASQIEDLALPCQAASALRSVSGSTKRVRVQEELQHELYDLEPTDAGAKRVADLFARVRELSEFAGELLEELEPFFAEYLQRWDGSAHRKLVFDLVALIKPLRFRDLHRHYLRPLETFAKADSVDGTWIPDFFACLTALVSNWAVRDDWDETVSRSTALGALEPDAPYLEALQGILEFANKQIELACQQRPHDLTIRSASLAFYELALSLPLEFGLPVVVLPSSTFMHTCLLSNEVMSLSRICGILARLREALTGASTALEINSESNTALVTELNARLIEFVATLWQKRFLTPADPAQSNLGLSLEDLEDLREYGDERGQATSASFGLSTHPALATLAKDCLSVLAVERGKSISRLVGAISTSSLKQLAKEPDGVHISFNEFRPAFLEWVQEQGADGLSDFLFSSLVSLVKRRASNSASQTPA
ncbi:centromere protein I [Rhodotorula toruloides]|uniref:Centromere protein I n=1 Tax=Rhodotorula toruloides TaxID=5286 RepID=A0A511KQP4_RHOTO|nr:centromere protein I [Rhodotorula toruloides]